MGLLMGNGPYKYSQKAFSDGLWSILKPLYDSNMEKVSIEKLSKNFMFGVRSLISSLPKKVGNTLFTCFFFKS